MIVSSICSGGVDGGSEFGASDDFGCGDPTEPPDAEEARRVEFDDVVES